MLGGNDAKHMISWLSDFFGDLNIIIKESCETISRLKKDYDTFGWEDDCIGEDTILERKYEIEFIEVLLQGGASIGGNANKFDQTTASILSMYETVDYQIQLLWTKLPKYVHEPIPRDVMALLQTLFTPHLLSSMILIDHDTAAIHVATTIANINKKLRKKL